MKKMTDKERLAEARELGRDEGAAWAVACLVKSYGTSTESMELAEAWGLKRLLEVADETDLPHLKKLLKDYPGKFQADRAALRAEKAAKTRKPQDPKGGKP